MAIWVRRAGGAGGNVIVRKPLAIEWNKWRVEDSQLTCEDLLEVHRPSWRAHPYHCSWIGPGTCTSLAGSLSSFLSSADHSVSNL